MFALLSIQDPTESALTWMRNHAAADAALVAGRLDEARSGFEHCRELEPQNATIAYALACVAARSGDVDRAFAALDDAHKLGYHDAALADWDVDLDSVKHDARWKSFIAALRATGEETGRPVFPWITSTTTKSKDSELTTFAEVSVPGECVIVGDSLGHLRRLDLHTGALDCEYKPIDGPVWRIATHPRAAEFAVLSDYGELSFFHCGQATPFARGMAFPREYRERQFPFRCYLEYSPDGERIAVRAEQRCSSVWSSRGVRAFDLGPLDSVDWYVDLAWSSDGSSIARRSDADLFIHDAATGVLRAGLATPSFIFCARFDPTGERLATGHEDGTIRLWDARSLDPIGRASVPLGLFASESDRSINTVNFTLDGSRVAYSACEGICLGVLDAPTARVVMEWDGFSGHWCEPVGLLVNHDATALWYSPGCGGSGVEGTDAGWYLHNPALWGITPRANASGLVAFACVSGVACFDVERRLIRWARPMCVTDALVQADSGHFGVVPLAIDSLWVERSYPGSKRDPLVAHARSLFDPKRVRASLDGVELELWR